nr:MAG TPA_asm: hypothetical protein [Caudoviricetes sp.]
MTLLNSADAIYLGDRTVNRVYVGAQRVWPPGSGMVYVGPQLGTLNAVITGLRPYVFKITLPTDGEIVEIVADRPTGTSPFKIVLYSDNGGVPDKLIYVSDEQREAVSSLPVSIPVTAGSYWLGTVSSLNNATINALAHEPGLEIAMAEPNSWPSWTGPNPTEWVGSVSPPQNVDRVPYVGLWYVPAE